MVVWYELFTIINKFTIITKACFDLPGFHLSSYPSIRSYTSKSSVPHPVSWKEDFCLSSVNSKSLWKVLFGKNFIDDKTTQQMAKIIPPDGATSLHFQKTATCLKGHFAVSFNYLLLVLFKVARICYPRLCGAIGFYNCAPVNGCWPASSNA